MHECGTDVTTQTVYNKLNYVNRSEHPDEFVRLEASEPSGTVGSNVLRDGESLPVNVAKHTATVSGDIAVSAMARSYVGSLHQQPPRAHHPSVDEAELTVGNMASDVPSLYRNSSAVPSNTRMMPEMQLLPPTAFMLRTDGTPILDSKTGHGHMSVFEKREQRSERDGDSSAANILGGSRTKDVKDVADDCNGGESENVADRAAELLCIRQTLRTFADNKDKLKFVPVSFSLLIS